MFALTVPLQLNPARPDTIYYHGHILTGVGLGDGRLVSSARSPCAMA